MDWRREKDGTPTIVNDRHFWVDEYNQPIPEHIKPPCLVLSKGGVNFAVEKQHVSVLRELLDEAEAVFSAGSDDEK